MEPQVPNRPDNHIDYFAPKVLWTILVILLLVVVLGIIAYAYIMKDIERNLYQARTAPTQRSEQSAIPADWKTYRNEEYGFEFKYPSDWKMEPEPGTKRKVWMFMFDKKVIARIDIDNIPLPTYWVSMPEEKINGYNFTIKKSPSTLSGEKVESFYGYQTNVGNLFLTYHDSSQTRARQILSTFKFIDKPITTYPEKVINSSDVPKETEGQDIQCGPGTGNRCPEDSLNSTND